MPKLPNKSIALIVSAIESIIVANMYTSNIVLAISKVGFGERDPIFNLDISFFMFIEPVLKLIVLYFIGIFVAITLYSFGYYVIVLNKFFDGVDRQTLKKSPVMQSLYKNIKNPSVKSKITLDKLDYFEQAKLDAENLIKSKLKNYTIYRIPLVLSDSLYETFMYHGKRNDLMDVVTKEDCAYAFVKGIKYSDELNRKTFNVAGEIPVVYGNVLDRLLEYNGLSFKYVSSRLFLEKDYVSPVCSDRDELENIIHFRNDSLAQYYKRIKQKRGNKRI